MPPIPESAVPAPAEDAGEERSERLALNLFDLDRMVPQLRTNLLWGRINLAGAVLVEKDSPDERGVIFTCRLLEAATLCDIIRSEDRKSGDTPTRIYLEKDGKWKRVPENVLLTVVVDGSVLLNPQVFRGEGEYIPPTPKRVEF